MDRVHRDSAGEHHYVVFVPQGEPPQKGWPCILYLHGAGERGTDGRRHVEMGIGPAIRERHDSFPAVVVFPQADFAEGPILETWREGEPGGRLALSILADVEDEWPIDASQRTLTGWSMGGYGALSLAAADAEHWSKVLTLAGGGEPEWAAGLSQLPVWMIHGGRDAIVPVTESRAMAAALDDAPQSLFSEVADAHHGLWRWVYDRDDVLDWLLSPSDARPTHIELTLPPHDEISNEESPEVARPAETFLAPVLSISRAMTLRLGNDALATLSDGIPDLLADEGLRGKLQPVEDEVTFDDRTFSVRFADMSYRAMLHRAILRGRGADRLRVEFALRDFTVRIGKIEVSDTQETNDSQDSVTAGPVTVVIGHREPVWLKMEVMPMPSKAGSLELRLLRLSFSIPDHNWHVKPPEAIDIRGELFSEDIVRTAIVGGVYVRKETIEEKIRESVPHLLHGIEQKFDFSPLAKMVTALWPLPMSPPPLAMRLEGTSTDRDGVSLTFACDVFEEDSPEFVVSRFEEHGTAQDTATGQDHVHDNVDGAADEIVVTTASAAYDVPHTHDLQAAVSLDVLKHLSAMVAGSEMASLYAADVPGRPFHELNDVLAVGEAIGVADLADVRSRFVMQAPLTLTPLTTSPLAQTPVEPGDSVISLSLNLPKLRMDVFGQRTAAGPTFVTETQQKPEWQMLTQRELTVHQPLQIVVRPNTDGPTRLQIAWNTTEHTRPSTADRDLDGLFRLGWNRWTSSREVTDVIVPDLAVGSSTLRLERFAWADDCLCAAFHPAATVLVNHSGRQILYRVKGPHSHWSQTYQLDAGDQHVYHTGTPIVVREASRFAEWEERLTGGTYVLSPSTDDEGRFWLRTSENTASVADR